MLLFSSSWSSLQAPDSLLHIPHPFTTNWLLPPVRLGSPCVAYIQASGPGGPGGG